MQHRPNAAWVRRYGRIGAVVAATMLLASAAPAASAASGPAKIRVLSNRADLISGGDALVEIDGVRAGAVRVNVDGRDVTGEFALRPNGRFQGIVTGLRVGANVLSAVTPGGSGARITIVNHPIGGPIFSGPQTQPWVCSTEANGLGPPLDAQCDAPPKTTYDYISTNPTKSGFQPYDPSNPPSDVAMTTTDDGKTVPFIVRVETGVIDRGIYQFAVLADPKQPWEPWAPQKTWNRKLFWSFGPSCNPSHVQPADSALTETDLADTKRSSVLGRGWALGVSGMTVLGSQCNGVVSAEAMMMVKQRIIDTLGPIRYTMSEGGSGGSIQQHWIVSDYPGLLDGILPHASFPDLWEATQEAQDCHVLDHYFTDVSPYLWPAPAQQDAVTGYMTSASCRALWDGPTASTSEAETVMDPSNAAGCGLPAAEVYNAQTNPHGVRCTVQDYMSSIFGLRPKDGFANYPYDNTGVQYGLSALNSGKILPEQFVDLNEKVGGLDIDWNYQAQRSVADAPAVTTMYRAGLVTDPHEAAKVPIIDLRGTSNAEIHTDFHSYAMRARLDQANGTHANQLIWTNNVPNVSDPQVNAQAFNLLDTWLSRIGADHSDRPLAEKVLLDRPAAAVDACWIGGHEITDMQTCRAVYPYFADPRISAGGPLADNVIKCQLKPLDPSDYNVQFTADQWAGLQKTFPDGVCDYSKPPVGYQSSIPWMTFAGGPGGQPLPPAPTSIPFTAGGGGS